MYYVYILRCAGGTLYTGIAADIERRMKEHFGQTEKCAKYTRSHRAESLEALWTAPDRSLASKLEYRIKQLTKVQKLRLIADEAAFEEITGGFSAEDYHREDIALIDK